MISGGDEVARTQRGNNNCYCQDNELSWYDWNLDQPRIRLLDFTRKLVYLRLAHPNLHRRKFFQDREVRRTNGDVLDTVKGRVVVQHRWKRSVATRHGAQAWTRAIA